MAVIKKTLFPKNLSNYSVLVNDTAPNSRYFQISELPDTFTGGKNAFLIAGSEELVPDTKIQIELKDSAGNIIYHEPGEGMVSSSINGETFVTEYYEGVSKVVAVYVYPDTAYGPCTLTVLGELNQYVDENGIIRVVPAEWENKYNVKWEKQINVNPSLPNVTKIRFYQRPKVTITEILSPIYRIESGSKVNSGVSQSFADIKLSQLETFAGDVKRVKVFRTSQGDISDFDLIQDILVESKELLTSYGLTGSVVGQTGVLTSETLQNYWNTGSLTTELTSSRVESGLKLSGSGYFTYTSSLDIKSGNTYELNLDAFYSSSTSSNLGIYLSQVTTSMENNVEVPIIISSSIATLMGTQPTKNLLDTIIPFQIERNYPSASLYFSQSQGEWHLGNISLKLSQDTAFSPDEISFITTMPTIIGNETYNFKFEFYDVNNNYVPVFVTGSQTFTGGNTGQLLRSLTFDSDRTAFRFSTGSFGNPTFQQLGFKISKQNLTGSVTYGRSVFDTSGNYISPASYAGTYPGTLTNASDAGATLTIANFSGSVASVLVGSIVYTASCDGLEQFETIYRFEDGDNAPGVFVTANTNQFIYKATDLSLNPTGQVITIEAKRKNLASATTPLTVNSGSGKPPLTFVNTNSTTGVDTYTIAGTTYPYETNETIYSISGSDQFGNQFSDSIKISPVKILDGFSVAVTNENTSFPATSTGTVIGGFAASSGSITVKVGNEDISYASPIANNKFSASISSTSNLTANTFNGTSYSINALSADSGSLTLLVKYQDGGGTIISSSKDITYSKVKKAAPILNFIVGNNNQSVTAKSTGAQIDTFLTASFNVLETYDGVVTSKSLTITKINTTNSYATGSTTSTTLALPNITDNNVNSVDISITGSVVDSETTTRNVFGNISLSKVKKAQPTITFSITPQAQTVGANSAGTLTGTIVDPVLSAFEGSSVLTYNQGTLTNSQYKITSVTGVTVTSQTPNTSTIDVTAIAADDNTGVVGISYVDSEGTSGTSTIKFLISKAKTGADGSPGAAGATGPGLTYVGECSVLNNSFVWTNDSIARNVTSTTGTYYITKPAAHGLAKSVTGCPPNATYFEALQDFDSVATDIFLAQDATITRGLVMGTFGATDKGFIRSANATALMTGKGYYLDATGSMRFGDPSGAYVKFTESDGLTIAGSVSISGTATIDGASATTVKSGAASGATAQQNGSAKTAGSVGGWTVDSEAIYSGTKDISGYSTTGITLYSGGSIHAKNFYIDTSGNGFFKGEVTALSGFIGSGSVGFAINNTYFRNGTKTTFNGAGTGVYIGTDGIGLDTAFTVSSAGVLTATAATITGNITATNIIATTAGNIAGWSVGPTTLGTSKIKLNSSRPAIEIYDTNNEIAVDINNQASLSPRIAGTTVVSNVPYTTTANIQGTDGSETTEPSFYQIDNGDNPLYSTGGTPISFVPSATGTYNATINLGGLISQAQGALEPSGVSPSPVYVNLSATYTIGASIRSGGINGTEVANFSSFTNYGAAIGTTSFNRSSTPNSVLIGTINVTSGTTYYIIPYITNGEVSATISNGNLSTQTLTVRYYTPTITAVSIAKPISKSELVAGGFQVIFNTDRWIQIARANNDDFVSIGGGLTATGDITANTSDIRLKENIRIIENPLEKIENIRGVYFNYTDEAKLKTGYTNGEEQIGFIAQEVKSVLPHIVKPAPFDKDQSTGKSISGENYLTIQYEKIVPLLLEGIKELKKQIEELKKNK
jgi:hypothetical protein